MKTGFELVGEARGHSGRTDARRLRRDGKVPVIVYGGGKEPRSISLDHNTLIHQMQREAFYTSLVTLKVGAESEQVVVKDVQRHPVRTQVLHMDLQRVVEDEEITLSVPIHFLGGATAKGVKEQGGELQQLLTDVEVVCLPRYLPEFLELDVSAMELNDILHLSDLKLPDGVELLALRHNQDHPVVAINPPRREEEEAPAEAQPGEVPATAQPSEPTSGS